MPVNIVYNFLKQKQSNENQNNALPSLRLHEGLLRNRTHFLLQEIDRADSTVSIVFIDAPAMTAYNRAVSF